MSAQGLENNRTRCFRRRGEAERDSLGTSGETKCRAADATPLSVKLFQFLTASGSERRQKAEEAAAAVTGGCKRRGSLSGPQYY